MNTGMNTGSDVWCVTCGGNHSPDDCRHALKERVQALIAERDSLRQQLAMAKLERRRI